MPLLFNNTTTAPDVPEEERRVSAVDPEDGITSTTFTWTPSSKPSGQVSRSKSSGAPQNNSSVVDEEKIFGIYVNPLAFLLHQ